MKVHRFRVLRFQSFADSGEITLNPGINLIIGQNNSGKSSLLRSLLASFPDDRHRNSSAWETFRIPTPEVHISVEVSGDELRDELLRSNRQVVIPANTSLPAQAYAQRVLDSSSLCFDVFRRPTQSFAAKSYPSHGLFDYDGSQHVAALVQPRNADLEFSRRNAADDTLPDVLSEVWNRSLYFFEAERMNVGEAGHGHAHRLSPNAQNLPNVLHTLSNERGDVFGRLVNHLREIFSTVGNVRVRTNENNQLEVRIWPTERMERVELSFPLKASGTGVAQVLALLAAITTAESAVIVIDEINSFLHPAAVKSLLRIIQTHYSHHQYIISTHSPEVISFSGATSVHLVKRDGYESTVQTVNLTAIEELREVADHLGVSMADVFAADRVVWVEGPTEEKCFPYVYSEFNGSVPRGVVFSAVAATGDFNSKRRDPEIVYEVYRRLSSAVAGLTVSVAFSFDTEMLTAEQKEKMTRDSQGLLRFLPRRHIECYLLDPAAILEFIVAKDPSSAYLTTDGVEQVLAELADHPRFRTEQWNGDLENQEWLASVDAANLISATCERLSEHRATFNKKDDSLFLLKSLVARDPHKLAPLATYIATLLDSAG